jgi:hypothetical protein
MSRFQKKPDTRLYAPIFFGKKNAEKGFPLQSLAQDNACE